MDHTQAIRKTVVTRLNIAHKKPGDPMYPGWATDDDCKDVWVAFITTRSGLLPETVGMQVFYSEVDAADFAARFAVGKEIPPNVKWIGHEERRLHFIREKVSNKSVPRAGTGDEDSPLAFDVLIGAGLETWGNGISPLVRDSLGRRRIGELKNLFGDNWAVAAVFEYCWINLPPSSPAYIAALYKFHWYITGDDFAAGYLWRDLETLVHGVEAAALNSVEMRKKAGLAGSEKSVKARETRRTALMEEMEAITVRNPDFAKLGADTVARLAIDGCAEKAPALWKQGRGQVSEYLGEIRRGEAGQDMRARFEKLFGTKPLRRLPI
ncbi:hypothetical protein AB3480_06615 [Rhizobium mongolense]|uniref:hypothetical protein n=1 Tax=Rhizobium mongolense TaxID=57676 RepID=UPI0034A22ED3